MMTRDCTCTHAVEDHHLIDGRVSCWGELAYIVEDQPASVLGSFLVAHCDCDTYRPAMTMEVTR